MSNAAPDLPAPPDPSPPIEPRRCPNCDAALVGPYCAQCGQKVHDFHISLWHLWDEFAEDYFHFESRLPRTVWYLISRPGFLTREFFAGRRARYVGPFKLYLLASVLFFLVVALVRPRVQMSGPHGKPPGKLHVTPPAKDASKLDRMIEQKLQQRLEKETPEQLNKEVRQRLVRQMPDAMLALVPVFALMLKLLYRKRYYAEHFVCALHLHAAGYLAMLASETPWGLLGFLAFLAFCVYGCLTLRRVYEQGWFKTLLKAGVLAFGYTCAVAAVIASLALASLLIS